MDRSIWPLQLCEIDYTIDFPSKVPPSYSIVVLGVPAQWDLGEFEDNIKKQYPTTIKVERLYARGGVPVSKIRIDFSSNEEVTLILKKKKLLIDEENTPFEILPYTPPIKILRCYNCQQYNDHIAANCPHKDNPVCFRCGQNHPFNPKCTNKICCANCKEEHLAGSPSCKVKIEERNKFKINMTSSNRSHLNQRKELPTAWTDPTKKLFIGDESSNLTVATTTLLDNPNPPSSSTLEISNKLDLILSKIDNLSAEHDNLKTSLINCNQHLTTCKQMIFLLKEFITEKICPLITEVGEGLIGKKQDIDKKKIRPLISNFNQGLKLLSESIESHSNQLSSLFKSSSYESITDDI